MRILMVAPTPFFADRGCHVRILGESRALAQLGHEVKIATYPLGRDMDGLDIHRTLPVPWYRKLSAGPSYHKYYIDVLLVAAVARLVRSYRPDLVHAHLHEGAAVTRLALRLAGTRGIPILLDYQGSLSDEILAHEFTGARGLQYRMLRRVEAYAHRTADHIITSTSRATAALVTDWNCPAHKVTTVPDGADTQAFRPLSEVDRASVRARYGLPVDRPLCIYVGVLSDYQGIDLLLDAVARLQQNGRGAHYVLVGYPRVEQYRRMAGRLGLGETVTFTGRVPYEETAALTAAADIALAPKISASEGNLKIFNYMACGLPVVCFDNPVNREVLDRTGSLVPGDTPEALAEAMGALLLDSEARRRLGAEARRRVERLFSWNAAAEKIEQVYRRCAQPRQAA